MKQQLAKIAISLTLLTVPLAVQPVYAQAKSVRIMLDGQAFYPKQPFFEENGVVYAPLREALSELGFSVTWNEAAKAVVVANRELSLELKANSRVALLNRIVTELDAAPRLVDGAMFIPLQTVAATLGQSVVWSEQTGTLYIKPDLATNIWKVLAHGDDKLTYDGDSVLGLKQGTGALYYEGTIWYEGEFSQNKMEGQGKLYENGRLIYEGGFKGQLPDGEGIFYDKNGSVYSGQFKAGKKNGEGTLTLNSKVVYFGMWKNDQMEGRGNLRDSQGNVVYEGELLRGQRSGYGVELKDGKRIYAGNWKNGKREGNGRAYDANGNLEYAGNWSDGERSGAGTSYSFSQITVYQTKDKKVIGEKKVDALYVTMGTFRNGKRLTTAKNLVYIGEMSASREPHGKGELSYTLSLSSTESGVLQEFTPYYEGDFVYGELTGTGKLYDEQANLLYEGELANGVRSGQGKSYKNGAVAYEGSWSKDKENGTGRVYEYDATFTGKDFEGVSSAYLYEGSYANGKLTESGSIYRYFGDFKEGSPNGTGQLTLLYDAASETKPTLPLPETLQGVLIYDGEFKNGLKNGKGKLYDKGVLLYDGAFVQNEFSGQGTLYQDNVAYKGAFVHGKREGEFTAISTYKLPVFEGTYKNDLKNGRGKLYDSYGKLTYEGDFLNGKRHGYGKLYYTDGTVYYQGEFKEDKTISEYLNSLKP